MKLCLDAGHGMSNRKPGLYDPGASYAGVKEADYVFQLTLAVAALLSAENIPFYCTRARVTASAPLAARVSQAVRQHCTALLSIHLNAANSSDANGFEVLYGTGGGPLAVKATSLLAGMLPFRMRAPVYRPSLAILQFPGPALLVEVGFLSNECDRRLLLDEKHRQEFPAALASVGKLLLQL